MATDARIEDYLDHVCAPLVGVVPYARRAELRAELRGHLEALVATHEELGSGRDVAVLMALRQFGPPRDIARQWAREWMQGPATSRFEPAWRAMGIGLGSFGVATLLALGVFAAVVGRSDTSLGGNPTLVVIGLVGILLPLQAGLITGLLAPARQALGSFCALALLILTSAGVALHALMQPGEDGNQVLSLGLALVQPLFWIPIGCGAAALGGSLRARLALRPGRWVLQ